MVRCCRLIALFVAASSLAACTTISDPGGAPSNVVVRVIETKLSSDDSDKEDAFGRSVAVERDTLVIGAAFKAGTAGPDQGAAYVYARSGGIWRQQAKLTASDPAQVDEFGTCVALSGDTIAVGAYKKDGPAGDFQGAAYVFVRTGTHWKQQTKVLAADAKERDCFGISVALSGDTLLVGSPQPGKVEWGRRTGAGNGAAYVFRRKGGGWRQEAKLVASDGARADGFGSSVALQRETAVVGAMAKRGPKARAQGAAYVFTRSGATWAQEAKLLVADARNDYFGNAVSLDGDTAIVGAYQKEGPGGKLERGAAYAFVRTAKGWVQEARLPASDIVAHSRFGFRVAVLGNTAVVGADGGNAAYVFKRSDGHWTAGPKLVAYDPQPFEWFGWSVALSEDLVVVGAPFRTGPVGPRQGAVYVQSPVPSMDTQPEPPPKDAR
jgi:hypothetical protein